MLQCTINNIVTRLLPTFVIANFLRQFYLQSYSNAKRKAPKDRFWRFQKSKPQQIYDYFLVIDFEATCSEEKKIPIQVLYHLHILLYI
jgi:hypothetical protein